MEDFGLSSLAVAFYAPPTYEISIRAAGSPVENKFMKISKFVHPVKKQPYCSYEMKNTGGNHYDKEKRYITV